MGVTARPGRNQNTVEDCMTEQLKPCPFCGEQPRMMAYAGDVGGVHIECETPDCPASPISTGGSMMDPLIAWNAWNRRVEVPS